MLYPMGLACPNRRLDLFPPEQLRELPAGQRLSPPTQTSYALFLSPCDLSLVGVMRLIASCARSLIAWYACRTRSVSMNVTGFFGASGLPSSSVADMRAPDFWTASNRDCLSSV